MIFKDQDKFRFTEKGHLHEMLVGDSWQVVPGCSTIAGLFDDKGWMGWWAAGQALAPMGWMKLEKDKSNQLFVYDEAAIGLEKIRLMTKEEYCKYLDTSYRAHAKETKDTAEAGTLMHEALENYIKDKINPERGVMWDSSFPTIFKESVEKFLVWEKENEIEWLASEVQVGSLMFQFCGILDTIYRCKGRIVLDDFKTSKVFKTQWIPQLVGLKQCCEEMGVHIDDIASTRLSREGEFEHKVIPVDHETELMAFLKAKDFYRARNLFKARFK